MMKRTVAAILGTSLGLAAMSGCDRPEPGGPGVETWSVLAELVEVSDFPTREEIRPYRDALIAHRYRILEKRSGGDLPGELAIYHWAIVDARNTTVESWTPGEVFIFTIQRMADRSDLKGRYRKNSLDAFDLQEFYGVETSRPDGRPLINVRPAPYPDPVSTQNTNR